MIGKREIRMALTGALLFLAIGSLQACASEGIAGPEKFDVQASNDSTDADTCYWVGPVLHCS